MNGEVSLSGSEWVSEMDRRVGDVRCFLFSLPFNLLHDKENDTISVHVIGNCPCITVEDNTGNWRGKW